MTMLDRSGNDFDQSSLLIALLRQAGYTKNYIYGQVYLIPEDITSWLGVPADVNVVGRLLPSAGIPCELLIYPDGLHVDMDHVWVKVNIDGTDVEVVSRNETNLRHYYRYQSVERRWGLWAESRNF